VTVSRDCQAGADALVSASAQSNQSVRSRPHAADILATQCGSGPDAGRLRQGVAELAARVDAELGEDVAQVVLDRARAEEQPGADLGVG
jgi:hypothetical protein